MSKWIEFYIIMISHLRTNIIYPLNTFLPYHLYRHMVVRGTRTRVQCLWPRWRVAKIFTLKRRPWHMFQSLSNGSCCKPLNLLANRPLNGQTMVTRNAACLCVAMEISRVCIDPSAKKYPLEWDNLTVFMVIDVIKWMMSSLIQAAISPDSLGC